jgi:hypothetical protein
MSNIHEINLGKEIYSKFALGLSAFALAACAPSAFAQEVPTGVIITGTEQNPTHLEQVNAEAWISFDERCKQEGLEVHIEEADKPENSEEFCVPGMTPFQEGVTSNAIFSTESGTVNIFDSSRT